MHSKTPWTIHGKASESIMGNAVDIDIVDADGFPVAQLPFTAIRPDWPEKYPKLGHWAHGEGKAYVDRDPEEVLYNALLISDSTRAIAALADHLGVGAGELARQCAEEGLLIKHWRRDTDA